MAVGRKFQSALKISISENTASKAAPVMSFGARSMKRCFCVSAVICLFIVK